MVAGLWTRERGGQRTMLGLDRQRCLWGSSSPPGSLSLGLSCRHPEAEVVRTLGTAGSQGCWVEVSEETAHYCGQEGMAFSQSKGQPQRRHRERKRH